MSELLKRARQFERKAWREAEHRLANTRNLQHYANDVAPGSLKLDDLMEEAEHLSAALARWVAACEQLREAQRIAAWNEARAAEEKAAAEEAARAQRLTAWALYGQHLRETDPCAGGVAS